MFWLSVIGLIKAVTMATSRLVTGKHILHFILNSLIFIVSFGEFFSYFNLLLNNNFGEEIIIIIQFKLLTNATMMIIFIITTYLIYVSKTM